jgi:predicted nucleotidyltransferase
VNVFCPTPYSEVNAILADLLSGLKSTLGKQFVGLYLYGSLATGDFDPQRSDVDFLVVTRTKPSLEMLSALESMHERISTSSLSFARRLEGVYIPLALLPRYDRQSAVHPYLGCGGKIYKEAQQDSDWIIQRHILREQGVVVDGPELRPLIDPVQPDDIRDAVRGFVLDWWAPMVERSDRLHDREYQAYATLTFCRVLYTLHSGEIGSKVVSARWVQQTHGEQWMALIDRALAWPEGPQPDEFEQTMAFLRYVVQKTSVSKKPPF